MDKPEDPPPKPAAEDKPRETLATVMEKIPSRRQAIQIEDPPILRDVETEEEEDEGEAEQAERDPEQAERDPEQAERDPEQAERDPGLMEIETEEEEEPTEGQPDGRARPAGDAPEAQEGQGAQASPASAGDDPLQGAFSDMLPVEDHDLVGQLVAGRYRVMRRLGEGGMGTVYLATHETIERPVALKVLLHEYARKQELKERFLREAKAAARIGHENIVDIHDFGDTPDGSVFFAMEFLEGRDLSRAMRDDGPFPWRRARPILLQLCRALMAAHSKGIIHRDLKPENIRLIKREQQDDFVKLLDFGIAKVGTMADEEQRLTKTGMIFGTPEYMSPEQAQGEKPDRRVDIYATGVIMYEMLTGDVPFKAETFMGILTKHLFEKPVPPSECPNVQIPPELEAIVLKAMAKSREDRFQSMREMAAVIAACNVGGAVDSTAITEPELEEPGPGPDPAGHVGRPTGPGLSEELHLGRSTGVGVDERLPVAPPPWRRRELQIGLGLALVVGAALLVYLTVRGPARRADPGDRGQEGVPAAGFVVPDAGGAAAAPTRIQIAVESTPPGAAVYRGVAAPGKEPVGRTPHTIETLREEGTLLLTLRLAGHADAQRTVDLRRDSKVVVELEESAGSDVPAGGAREPDAAPRTRRPPPPRKRDARVRRPPRPDPDPGPEGEVPSIKDPFKSQTP